MIKKRVISLVLFLLVAIISGCNISNEDFTLIGEKVFLEPTNENFLTILSTNQDGLDYLDKHLNTLVLEVVKIYPNEFESLRSQTDYKELYDNLPQKELYKVDFGSNDTTLSLTTIIDLEDAKVINIFGVLIMGME